MMVMRGNPMFNVEDFIAQSGHNTLAYFIGFVGVLLVLLVVALWGKKKEK